MVKIVGVVAKCVGLQKTVYKTGIYPRAVNVKHKNKIYGWNFRFKAGVGVGGVVVPGKGERGLKPGCRGRGGVFWWLYIMVGFVAGACRCLPGANG